MELMERVIKCGTSQGCIVLAVSGAQYASAGKPNCNEGGSDGSQGCFWNIPPAISSDIQFTLAHESLALSRGQLVDQDTSGRK